MWWHLAACSVVLTGLLFLITDIASAQLVGIHQAERDALMQKCRQIGLMLFSYEQDNAANGFAYPDGKSSTEVFQKLLDNGYCTDPSVFYTPLPGKTAPTSGQKLKPENVCFDVTSGVTGDSSDLVPVVFMTGYKVTYTAGSSAVPLVKPFPAGTVVCYKGNNTQVLFPGANAATDGSIPNFVPANFDAKGKTLVQLTPVGALP